MNRCHSCDSARLFVLVYILMYQFEVEVATGLIRNSSHDDLDDGNRFNAADMARLEGLGPDDLTVLFICDACEDETRATVVINGTSTDDPIVTLRLIAASQSLQTP